MQRIEQVHRLTELTTVRNEMIAIARLFIDDVLANECDL